MATCRGFPPPPTFDGSSNTVYSWLVVAVAVESVRKVNADRWQGTSNHRVETKATPFARQMVATMRRFARAELNRVRRDPGEPLVKSRYSRVAVVQKAAIDDFEAELIELFRRFGLQQLNNSGDRGAKAGGGSWLLRPEVRADFMSQSESSAKAVIANTRELIDSSLTRIVREAAAEVPQPTAQEIGRRIARTWFGSPGTGDVSDLSAVWERKTDLGEDALISFGRAANIARDELGEIENRGIAQGLLEAGVEFASWLAHKFDGRSGKRQHYLMNQHKPVLLSDLNGDVPSKWFRLPSGIFARRPHDAELPIGERAGCRCMLIPE